MKQSDSGWLQELLVGERGSRWKYRGRTPNPAEFESDLWRGVYSQWVVEDADRNPVGLVGLYNHRPAVSGAHLFAVAASGRGAAVSEAAGLLLSWGFHELDLDKVWIEAPEFNLAQFRSIESIAEIEGRLRDFDHWHGRFWDLFILSITRNAWASHRFEKVLDQRRGNLEWADSFDEVALATELSEVASHGWPLDSLGVIEVLTVVESAVGHPVDVRILAGTEGLSAGVAIKQIVASTLSLRNV